MIILKPIFPRVTILIRIICIRVTNVNKERYLMVLKHLEDGLQLGVVYTEIPWHIFNIITPTRTKPYLGDRVTLIQQTRYLSENRLHIVQGYIT